MRVCVCPRLRHELVVLLRWKSFEHVWSDSGRPRKGHRHAFVSVACTCTCHGTWVMVISAYIQIDDLSVEPYTQYMYSLSGCQLSAV